MTLFQSIAARVNTLVEPLLRSSVGTRLLGGSMTVLTYTGRRSGRTVSLPVGYRRGADGRIRVDVMLPEQKAWWRNFTGDGAPLTIRIDGRDQPGHGVTVRDERGTAVEIAL